MKGTHQCDFTNFWGTFGFQHLQLESEVRQSNSNVCMSVNKMCRHLGSLSLCYKLDNMDLSRIRHSIILAEGTRVLPVMSKITHWQLYPLLEFHQPPRIATFALTATLNYNAVAPMIWQVKAVLLAAHCNKMCFFVASLAYEFLERAGLYSMNKDAASSPTHGCL